MASSSTVGIELSPTLRTLASMTSDEFRYGGEAEYHRFGGRAYIVGNQLSFMGRDLIDALGSAWTSLKFADDVSPKTFNSKVR